MSIREEIAALSPDTKELRQFSWVVGIAFLLLGAFLWWRQVGWFEIPVWIGAILIVVGTLLPIVVKPFYFFWMSLAVVLGFIMTRVILTLFYFLILTPVGLFFRLIGRDALRRRLDPKASTYWIDKEYLIDDRSRLEKFF